jgi:DNA-binding HxlR family transcriptional regulator
MCVPWRYVSHSSTPAVWPKGRELEEDGLISRLVYAEVSPKVENRLTEKGKSLNAILLALEKWGKRYELPQAPAKVKSG